MKSAVLVEEKTEERDELTELVVKYKETGFFDPKILKLVETFAFWTGRQYYQYLPQFVIDELHADCMSLILLQAIGEFDPARGIKFTTFFG